MSSYQLKAFDHCELYVSNAKQVAHFYQTAFGFLPVAYRGLDTGSRDSVSYVMQQNQIRFILTSPLTSGTDIGRHIDHHGDGIKDVAFTVDDAEAAWKQTTSHGAKSIREPERIQDEQGEAVIATIKTFGDTTHTFIQRNNYRGIFLPGYREYHGSPISEPVGLIHMDHIVGNQGDGEMIPVCQFYENVFGWHRFWTVDDEDISTEYSSLRSIVMANDNEKIKIAHQ